MAPAGRLISATLLPLICFLVLLDNAAPVESARASGTFHWYRLFVFGDSFADAGNTPKSSDRPTEKTRQWFLPYGSSHVLFDGPGATGRFSNGMVQSDFIAKILGRSKSPPTYRRTEGSSNADPFGVNFAVGGAGVFELPVKAPTLASQIDFFEEILGDGTVGRWQLRDSAALVAVSGNDYAAIANNASSPAEALAFVGNVTAELAGGVARLRRLGVARVLVNTMHPLGCTPWLARPSNYTRCEGRADLAAAFHNDALKKKLNGTDGVYFVDLSRAFNNIVNPPDPQTAPQVAKQFKQKLKPCCESFDPAGFCGQVHEDGGARYGVCANPDEHFYWDDVHPTQAGWSAVMGQLERDIKDFLGI